MAEVYSFIFETQYVSTIFTLFPLPSLPLIPPISSPQIHDLFKIIHAYIHISLQVQPAGPFSVAYLCICVRSDDLGLD